MQRVNEHREICMIRTGGTGFTAAVLAAVCILAAFAATSGAAMYTWDPNGTSGIQGGSGTWSTSDPNTYWSDGSSNVAWSDNNDANFLTGSGTVNVSGGVAATNLYFATGTNYTITGGTLTLKGSGNIVANSNAVISSNLSALPTATCTVGSGSTLTISGSANGWLDKYGSGTLILSAENTISYTRVYSGTLVLANALALQDSVLWRLGGSVVFDKSVTSNAFSIAGLYGDIVLQNNASTPAPVALSLTHKNIGGEWIISSHISGPGSLAMIGSGTFWLAGSNSYAGGTNIAQGVLKISGDYVLGASNGSVTFTGDSVLRAGSTGISLNAGRTITVNSGVNGTVDTNGYNMTIGSSITGSGTLIKIGSGTLYLTNTSNHGVTVNAGVLNLSSGANVGSGVVTFGANTIVQAGADNINLPAIAVNAGVTGTLDTNGYYTTEYQQISGPGNLVKVGFGSLVLAGSNTFSGTTAISNGSLTIAHPGALAGSVLDYNNYGGVLTFGTGVTTAIFSGLKGGQNLTLQNTANAGVSLTISNIAAGQTNTYSGVLSGTGASLTYAGTGSASGVISTQILGGNNTFNGNITVSAGRLQITNSNALGIGTKTITLTNGIQGNPSLAMDGSGGAITLPSYFSFNTSNDSYDGAIVNFAGDNVINGVITLTGGSGTKLSVFAGTLTMNGNLQPSTAGQVLILAGTGNGTVAGKILDNGANTLSVQKQGPGTWYLTTTNTYSAGTTINGGALNIKFDRNLGAANTPITFTGNGALQAGAAGITIGTGRVITINSGATGTIDTGGYNVGFAGKITGGGSLTKAGSGILTLTGSNSYSGGTIISGGTLSINSDSALGSSSGPLVFSGYGSSYGALQVAATGNFTLNRPVVTNLARGIIYYANYGCNMTLAGSISGTGGEILLGAGTGSMQFGNGVDPASITTSLGVWDTTLHLVSGTSISGPGLTVGRDNGTGRTAQLIVDSGASIAMALADNVYIGAKIDGNCRSNTVGILDASAASGFSMNIVNSLIMGANFTSSGTGTPKGILKLPFNSTITAGLSIYLGISRGDANGIKNQISLGGGTCNISTPVFIVGSDESVGIVNFSTPGGTLKLQGIGTGRCNLSITKNEHIDGLSAFDMTGGTTVAYLDTLLIGQKIYGGNATAAGTFTTGISADNSLDINSLQLGLVSGNGGTGSGMFDMNGGTMRIGSVSMAANTGSGSATANGTLNINGGTVTLAGDIVRGGTGTSTATLNLKGGTLDMGGHSIGAAAWQINNVVLESGTLKNVAEINGGAALAKTGTGVLTLSGTNGFSGGISVNAGTLVISNPAAAGSGPITLAGGQLSASGGLVLQAGQSFTGQGRIDGNISSDGNIVATGSGLEIHGTLSGNTSATGKVSVFGAVSPGHSPGLMNYADLDASNADILMELGGRTAGTEYDQIRVSGTLTVGGALTVALYNAFDPQNGDVFHLFDGTISGQFSSVNLPGLDTGLSWNTSSLYSSGDISVTPEPATVSLLTLGGLAMLIRRRKT